jgi:hypothetical protein
LQNGWRVANSLSLRTVASSGGTGGFNNFIRPGLFFLVVALWAVMETLLVISDGTGDQDVMDFGFMIEDCALVYSKRIPEGLPGTA